MGTEYIAAKVSTHICIAKNVSTHAPTYCTHASSHAYMLLVCFSIRNWVKHERELIRHVCSSMSGYM